MKLLISLLIMSLSSLSLGQEDYGIYRVTVGTNANGGACFNNPLRHNAQQIPSEDRCEHILAEIVFHALGESSITQSDSSPANEILERQHDGTSLKHQYFCFKGDTGFNRELGQQLCDQKMLREEAAGTARH